MNSPLPPMPSWSWIFALIFGAAIGSFLNVVIYRLPRGLSLANPPKSFCPTCKHSLGPADLFPLLSWLVSKGKCRYCGEKVAARYFWVELINGSLWAAIWYQYVIVSQEPLKAGFYGLMVAALVAVIYIDWELYIIPDELNATLLVFGVGYHALDKSLTIALFGALLGWGLLWGIALLGRLLFGKDAMGHGDIKMMRGVGALLGPTLLVANLAIAVVAGLVIGLAMLAFAFRQKQAEEESSPEDGGDLAPESIGSLFVHGAWYLCCLDCLAIFAPKMNKLIGEEQMEVNPEEDDWKPSLTTIPFGPYLAIGAIICMLFASPIEKMMSDYVKKATHPAAARNSQLPKFAGLDSKQLNWATVTRVAVACAAKPAEKRGEGRIG